MADSGLFRRWVFTINNYTPEEVNLVEQLQTRSDVRGAVAGLEVGEGGTPHIQGAVVWSKPCRLAAMRKWIPRGHFEGMIAKWDKNANYCTKEANVICFKDLAQGERTDIISYVNAIRDGGREIELYKDEEFMPVWAKYQHIYPRVRSLMGEELSRNFRRLDVTVRYGKTGVGKTRWVHSTYPNVYTCQPDLFWWPGYDGQEIILIDEFYGQCKPDWLLRVLDGYPLQVQYKGGFTWALWTKVIITSNVHPTDWYGDTVPDDVKDAIKRRLGNIEYIE